MAIVPFPYDHSPLLPLMSSRFEGSLLRRDVILMNKPFDRCLGHRSIKVIRSNLLRVSLPINRMSSKKKKKMNLINEKQRYRPMFREIPEQQQSIPKQGVLAEVHR